LSTPHPAARAQIRQALAAGPRLPWAGSLGLLGLLALGLLAPGLLGLLGSRSRSPAAARDPARGSAAAVLLDGGGEGKYDLRFQVEIVHRDDVVIG
jgi:hypothetical protein